MKHSTLLSLRRPVGGARGFTLIEVMIVVAIVGILAAVAYPAYQNSIMKSRRSTAQSCLLELGQFMERFYSTNMRYDEDRDGAAVTLPAGGCRTDLEDHYTFQFGSGQPTESTYTLEAVPGTVQAKLDSKCKTLSVTHTGEKKVSGSGAVGTCWK